ncbi:MAG: hypothetical protein AMXMBFR58_10510 [Phycisphaerae bacterium]|nr:hypothetical protein [Phycisphaerales bacterium]MCK6475234.1 hypothetical protein [Phycisphaerales bacterium]
MSRLLHSSPLARRLLPVSIVLLVVTAFLPPAVGAWPGWFGRLLLFFVAPISEPVRGIASWLSPPEPKTQDTAIAAIQQQAEGYRQQLLRAQVEVEQLRQQITDLQRGALLNDLPVRQMHASVIATSSDLTSHLLRIKAGTAQGVEVNSVATVKGLQLLGRVVNADRRTCEIQPITSPAAGQIRGVVMLSDMIRGPECLLEPRGDGTLVGPVEDLRQWPPGIVLPEGTQPGDPVRVKVRQTVQLFDPSWPKSSQMLTIGVIEEVQPAPDQPLRQVITVRPTLRLERVSEVVLRYSAADEADGGERAGEDGDQ